MLRHSLGLTLDVRPTHPIRLARKALGWTMKDLARRSGVPLRTISDVERYRYATRPQEHTRTRLLRALGISEARREAMFPRVER